VRAWRRGARLEVVGVTGVCASRGCVHADERVWKVCTSSLHRRLMASSPVDSVAEVQASLATLSLFSLHTLSLLSPSALCALWTWQVGG
jgi:hypothetical protein